VFIGHNATILAGVDSIGNGAYIGACSLVNENVPPYAVIVGNPARIVKYRFSTEIIESLEKSKWWEKSIDDLLPDISEFQKSYSDIYTKDITSNLNIVGTNNGSNIKDKLIQFINTNFPRSSTIDICDDDDFIDHNIIDSLGMLELIAFVNNEFQVIVDDEAIISGDMQSISGVVSYIQANINNKIPTAE
jgi:acyl carrier protein